jgi:hypothetical protein
MRCQTVVRLVFAAVLIYSGMNPRSTTSVTMAPDDGGFATKPAQDDGLPL